eukprot:scaffold101453_cov48-Attheya_sp.AAC.1
MTDAGAPLMCAMASSKSDSTASDVPSAADQAQKIQQQAPAKVEWLQSVELGYEQKVAASGLNPSVCFHCGNSDKPLSKCATCRVASYCSRDCQMADWKASGGGHKSSCDAYKMVGIELQLPKDDDKRTTKESDSRLAELSLPRPPPSHVWQGEKETRSVLLHYLTLGEYDQELCRDDFELTVVRSQLQKAVNTYDEKKSVVVLMRFVCGHVSVGIAPLVPDYGICKSLAKDYFGEDSSSSGNAALQLNLDDI